MAVSDSPWWWSEEAVEGATGLPVNYWALIDLHGFEALVDAVGGITLDVNRAVPIGGGSTPISGYIEAGAQQHLDGREALWFARSRADSSDYDRMARRAALSHLHGSGVSSYLGAPAADYLHRGGKGLRPALCLATCTAFGGDVQDALPSAAAIELFHTAFLVHDDVEDDLDDLDDQQRLHELYGMPASDPPDADEEPVARS